METNWVGGIIGGLLIGSAASVLLLFNGRIAGISGIAGELFVSKLDRSNIWRLLFLAGLISGAAVYSMAIGGVLVQMQVDTPMLVVAGLLVGVGTKIGAGCTSGHGICGIGRLSPRSILATLIFVAVAMLTVWVTGWFK